MSRAPALAIRTKMQDRAVAVAAAAGVATGLVSTYPWELGPATCLTAWAVIGVLIGLLSGAPAGCSAYLL
jgi:hypothetical protein